MVDDLETDGKKEQIGYHKGALETLLKEKKELSRILNIVEQLIQMHAGALKEEGIDIQTQQKQQKKQSRGKEKPPIEDLLN